MNYKLTIVSPWIGSGTMEDSYRPQFGDDYTYITWSELSVRPSPDYLAAPNMGTLTCEVNDTILAVLEADSDYLILSVEEVFDATL